MNELDNLTTIETNSRRGGGQPFDLKLDAETNKFTVSDAFYAKEDMNNNGFTAHFNSNNNGVYLSIEPNDEAVSYKGREGHEKGKEFTSTNMSELMEKVGLTGSLNLEHVGEKEGTTYYRVEQMTEEDSSDTIEEELVGEDDDMSGDYQEPQTEIQTEEELV